MKAVLVYGAPGAGKSTLAKEYVEEGFTEINRDNIRFSMVDPGGDWTTYRFNKKNEKFVTSIWNQRLDEATFNMKSVVISDTLCNKQKRQNVVDYLKELGYTDITLVELNPPLEELLKRDRERGRWSVGEGVVRQKWEELNDGN